MLPREAANTGKQTRNRNPHRRDLSVFSIGSDFVAHFPSTCPPISKYSTGIDDKLSGSSIHQCNRGESTYTSLCTRWPTRLPAIQVFPCCVVLLPFHLIDSAAWKSSSDSQAVMLKDQEVYEFSLHA